MYEGNSIRTQKALGMAVKRQNTNRNYAALRGGCK